jgi:hypothetical protein
MGSETIAGGMSRLIYHWSTAGAIRVATWQTKERLAFRMCWAAGAWTVGRRLDLPPLPPPHPPPGLSAHSKQEADHLVTASRDDCRRLPFRVELSYGCACNDAGGQQSGRSNRSLESLRAPSRLDPTCTVAQHLLNRAQTRGI